MKYSGIEWIGNIPNNWKLNKIGQLFNLRNEKVSDTVYAPLSVTKGGVIPQMNSVAKSDASDDRKLVKAGDFAINSRSDRKMSCGVSALDGSVSLINMILYPKTVDAIYNDYMNYLLKNYGFAEEFYRWGHGIVADLWTTRWQEMKSIMLPLPPVDVQIKISRYLNTKNDEIEMLIDNQNKQIDKLKEYTVITEAVTKGLNKSVSMKDSGVEWIGKIPEKWKVSKVMFFYDVVLGKMLQPNKINDDETLENYLCAANVGGNNLKVDDLKKMWFSEKEKMLYEVKKGDLLVVEGGDVASSAFYNLDGEKVFIQNALHRVRSKQGNLHFLRYYLMFTKYSGYFEVSCNGATIAHFTKEKFRNLSFLVMPDCETEQIVLYLDKKCSEIDSLISLKQKKIDGLNEYKKSLIYEYVTGKKEVANG